VTRWIWAALCVLALGICVIDHAPQYVTAINGVLAGWTITAAASRKAGGR